MKLDGQVALIIGGARGIGAAIGEAAVAGLRHPANRRSQETEVPPEARVLVRAQTAPEEPVELPSPHAAPRH